MDHRYPLKPVQQRQDNQMGNKPKMAGSAAIMSKPKMPTMSSSSSSTVSGTGIRNTGGLPIKPKTSVPQMGSKVVSSVGQGRSVSAQKPPQSVVSSVPSSTKSSSASKVESKASSSSTSNPASAASKPSNPQVSFTLL